MKTKECLKRSMRLVELGIKKATSYKVVKGRLSRGLYSDDFLQARLENEKESQPNQIS
jgi:hypothetical protein